MRWGVRGPNPVAQVRVALFNGRWGRRAHRLTPMILALIPASTLALPVEQELSFSSISNTIWAPLAQLLRYPTFRRDGRLSAPAKLRRSRPRVPCKPPPTTA